MNHDGSRKIFMILNNYTSFLCLAEKGCKCRKELFKLNLTLKSRRLRATWWSNICGHKMRVGRFEFFFLFCLLGRGLNTRKSYKYG